MLGAAGTSAATVAGGGTGATAAATGAGADDRSGECRPEVWVARVNDPATRRPAASAATTTGRRRVPIPQAPLAAPKSRLTMVAARPVRMAPTTPPSARVRPLDAAP